MFTKLKVSYITHKGKIRSNNEDSIRIDSILVNSSQIDRPQFAEINLETGIWLAVADGLGGHGSGEIASGDVISAISKITNQDLIELNQKNVAKTLVQSLQSRIEFGDVSTNMGTTLSALYVLPKECYILHIGDSRIYSLSPFERLTKDDSVVEELIDQGQVLESMRRFHPLKNRLTSAITGSSQQPFLKINRIDLITENRTPTYLLCTDGLWENFDNFEIEEKYNQLFGKQHSDLLQIFSDWLLSVALDRGANDNISFIIVTLC